MNAAQPIPWLALELLIYLKKGGESTSVVYRQFGGTMYSSSKQLEPTPACRRTRGRGNQGKHPEYGPTDTATKDLNPLKRRLKV